MQKNARLLLRGLAFLLVLGIAVCSIQRFFGLESRTSYEHERGYLREERNSLDAVYIGGSDVHSFWQPCFGWNEKGIAVWNYSADSLSASAVKYMLIEARKTQKNALFIISLNTFKKSSTKGLVKDIHWAADYMPLSLNKLRMIDRLTDDSDIHGLDRLEFYFPIIRFHERWDSLKRWAFGSTDGLYKASMTSNEFRSVVTDLTDFYEEPDQRMELPEDVSTAFLDFLDFCETEQVNVLFIRVPQASSTEALQRLNTLEDIIVERGFPYLNLLDHMDELKLELHTDFYNNHHTNVHGSLKISCWLANYLAETYHFSDKRGTENWESWDETAASYMKFLEPVTFPFELDGSPRVSDLPIPVLEALEADGTKMTLRWSPSDGADGYEIFRLSPYLDNYWQSAAVVSGEELSFTNTGLRDYTTYRYTVVPFRLLDGERAYGSFDVTGVTAKTGGAS